MCATEVPRLEVSTAKTCEIQVLMRPSAGVYHSCDVRIRKEHTTFWKRLASQGGWLYSLSESETVHILCSGLSDKIVVLKGVGILHLSANCVERTRSATLTGIRTYDSTDQYVYAPQVNLNVSSIVLEIDNREPRDSIALPTLEEQHQSSTKNSGRRKTAIRCSH